MLALAWHSGRVNSLFVNTTRLAWEVEEEKREAMGKDGFAIW